MSEKHPHLPYFLWNGTEWVRNPGQPHVRIPKASNGIIIGYTYKYVALMSPEGVLVTIGREFPGDLISPWAVEILKNSFIRWWDFGESPCTP